MNPTATPPNQLGAFLAGMAVGLGAYALYLNFLTANEATAAAFGWIYFAPQYLILWVASEFDLTDTTTVVSCYSVITLFYGYIGLSIRLFTKTAIWVFWSTALICLSIILFVMPHKTEVGLLINCVAFIFWPLKMIGEALVDTQITFRPARLAIDCLSVAFCYTAMICGVRTFFMFVRNNGGSTPNHPLPVNSQEGKRSVPCINCYQQIRVPTSSSPVQVRCPSCQYQFNVEPQG